jgi:photosystem II stability/assembly factor-like uncharacterized protein
MAASKRLRVVAFAVGLVLVAAAPAVAQATWTQVPSPNRPGSNELQGADGADTSHVWAVGRVVDVNVNPATYRSLILRWDGSAWAPASHPRFARNHALRAVATPAANDAWAVGTRQVAPAAWSPWSNAGTARAGTPWPAPTRTRAASTS